MKNRESVREKLTRLGLPVVESNDELNAIAPAQFEDDMTAAKPWYDVPDLKRALELQRENRDLDDICRELLAVIDGQREWEKVATSRNDELFAENESLRARLAAAEEGKEKAIGFLSSIQGNGWVTSENDGDEIEDFLETQSAEKENG